jgi:hypothetical protein
VPAFDVEQTAAFRKRLVAASIFLTNPGASWVFAVFISDFTLDNENLFTADMIMRGNVAARINVTEANGITLAIVNKRHPRDPGNIGFRPRLIVGVDGDLFRAGVLLKFCEQDAAVF